MDTPVDSPLTMDEAVASPVYNDLWHAKLAPGDIAFDFCLPRLDTSGEVRLSTYAGDRPVALIFGSYT